MFTWNLPALIRNTVLFTILCMFLNWNILAWIFILFLIFAEMDEELTKFDSFQEYYASELELYRWYSAENNGMNLEEQTDIFYRNNAEMVNKYKKTFHNRIDELRARKGTSDLGKLKLKQTKAQKAAHKKEELRVKHEVFGYEENLWDEEKDIPTNPFVESMNMISANCMYAWFHQTGLIVPKKDSGIKNMCLYHHKYQEAHILPQQQNSKQVVEQTIQTTYDKVKLSASVNGRPQLYVRNGEAETEADKEDTWLYYGGNMTIPQKNKHLFGFDNFDSQKFLTERTDKRINYINLLHQSTTYPIDIKKKPVAKSSECVKTKTRTTDLDLDDLIIKSKIIKFKRKYPNHPAFQKRKSNVVVNGQSNVTD